MSTKKILPALLVGLSLMHANRADACTGITLKSDDGSTVVARTIDWSGTKMNNIYVVSPRNHTVRAITPAGADTGLEFTSKYGFVGLGMEQSEFVVDGMNEAGLSAALFYFPNYGGYESFNRDTADSTIGDLQLVSWILSSFSTIDEVQDAIKNVHIVNIYPDALTVHWRITDSTGRQVVLEIEDGVPHFYESEIGVLTNSPSYPWQVTNLNNYVNLNPGTAGPSKLGALTLRAFGAGSGMHGLPGDFSPPSRFVRAAFLSSFNIPLKTGYDASMHAFHILNNFDVPLAVQYSRGAKLPDMPSATQWTIATDMRARMIYYRTMYNSVIRSINMNDIDFDNVEFQWHPLDSVERETIIPVTIQ
ncbi:MAG: choloylglycine hydrolase family protein [Alphaproteobacteria bacterium]|nr:choloylglycine hydrolase family protein [Alphaproteobacteria bacterium]